MNSTSAAALVETFFWEVSTRRMRQDSCPDCHEIVMVMSRASALYKFPALPLVSIGSCKQKRLTDLGNAVALAIRYSFDLCLRV
jgi:hypothetical protein